LTYREREIMKLRYGIGDGTYYTLEEVGRIFKVTRERVRQIESKAMKKLTLRQPSYEALRRSLDWEPHPSFERYSRPQFTWSTHPASNRIRA